MAEEVTSWPGSFQIWGFYLAWHSYLDNAYPYIYFPPLNYFWYGLFIIQKERGYAAEQSALVIDAYRTLSNPLSRALYLVSSSSKCLGSSLFDIFWCNNVLCKWKEIINNHKFLHGSCLSAGSSPVLLLEVCLPHINNCIMSSTNKQLHFLHIWKLLIHTNLLAVKTWGSTCWWRKNYQWPRTSYGGNFIHLGIHVWQWITVNKHCNDRDTQSILS